MKRGRAPTPQTPAEPEPPEPESDSSSDSSSIGAIVKTLTEKLREKLGKKSPDDKDADATPPTKLKKKPSDSERRQKAAAAMGATCTELEDETAQGRMIEMLNKMFGAGSVQGVQIIEATPPNAWSSPVSAMPSSAKLNESPIRPCSMRV